MKERISSQLCTGNLRCICVAPTLGVSFSFAVFASLPPSALKTPVERSEQAGRGRPGLLDGSEPVWTCYQSFCCRNTPNTQVSRSFFDPEETVWGNSPICNGLSACDTQIRIFIPSFDLAPGPLFICNKAVGRSSPRLSARSCIRISATVQPHVW